MLAELGSRIEEHYGSPQDTEWAFDAEGHAYILQSRPVTSGPHEADGAGEKGELLLRGLGAAPGQRLRARAPGGGAHGCGVAPGVARFSLPT